MALAYGRNKIEPGAFSKTELSSFRRFVKEPTRSGGIANVGLFRILITILEVGALILLSKVGAAKAGLMLSSQVGVGLIGATINTVLSAKNKSLTGIGVAIDYSTAFIPAIVGAYTSVRIAQKLEKIDYSKWLKKFAKQASHKKALKVIARTPDKDQKIWKEVLLRYQKIKKYEKILAGKQIAERARIDYWKRNWALLLKKHQKPFINFIKWLSTDPTRVKYATELAYWSNFKIGGQKRIIDKLFAKLFKNKKNLLKAKRIISQWKQLFAEVKKIPFFKRMTQNQFLYHATKLAPASKKKFVREFYTNALLSPRTRAMKDAILKKQKHLFAVMGSMSKRGQEAVRLFVARFKAIPHSLSKMKENVNMLVSQLSVADSTILNSALKGKETVTLFEHLATRGIFPSGVEKGTLQGWIKSLGSPRFNEAFVQRAQLLDPNDVGRYPIELLYQKFRKIYEKRLFNKAFREASRKGVSNIKKSKNLTEAFKRSGGKIIKNKDGSRRATIFSRYIIGAKMLPGGTALKRWVLVKFNPLNARAINQGYKNYGGKKDIIVTMTDNDFDRLVTEGTSYWFAVGMKKGWMLSRGGKKISNRSRRVLGTSLSLFLNFVPVPALRNLLSIVSNWVENIDSMARGDYFKTWWAKFTRAFIRSAINRSARFTAKVVIGSTYRGYKTGQAFYKTTQKLQQQGLRSSDEKFRKLLNIATAKAQRNSLWLGRELQRAGTTTLTSFQKTDADGYLSFRKRTAQEIATRFVKTSLPTSLRSSVIRKERSIGREIREKGQGYGVNYGRQLINTKRYLGQIGRIYSAITPNTAVQSLRKLTRFGR